MKQHILLIEDSATQAQNLQAILRNEYSVTLAMTALEGLKLLNQKHFDLLLLDMVLPDMAGLEVLQKVRDDDRLRHIPVIIITGVEGHGYEEQGIMNGAVDYINKPYSDIVVRARIRMHLRLQSYILKLEEMTLQDQLTGIGNRRYYDVKSIDAWNQCARLGLPISISMMDVDKFKLYNDTYGHPAGDKILRILAQAVKSRFRRATDLVARYGGEEFVVVVSGGEAEKNFNYFSILRKDIESLKINHSDVHPYVTISIGGVTIIPKKEMTIDTFLKKADEALYIAKESGRNKVVWITPTGKILHDKAPL